MGRVVLIGAGPGPADLLTLRAAKALACANLVLHDALVSPEVLALAPQARVLNVGKRAHRPSTDQEFINRLLVRAARRYALVVRLKGGDPMLFGRAQEEIDACLHAGVCVEAIPGISAAFAASADLLVSLTQRGLARSVTFATPALGRGEAPNRSWVQAAMGADVAALYMAKTGAAEVAAALIAAGMAPSRPAALVENAGAAHRAIAAGRLGDLAALAARLGDGPALILLGDTLEALALAHEGAASTRRSA